MLEHYSSEVDFSILCCPKAKRSEALTLVNLERLAAKHKLNDVESFRKEYLDKIDEKIQIFNAFVTALHAIVVGLPRQPLGKNVKHLLSCLRNFTKCLSWFEAKLRAYFFSDEEDL